MNKQIAIVALLMTGCAQEQQTDKVHSRSASHETTPSTLPANAVEYQRGANPRVTNGIAYETISMSIPTGIHEIQVAENILIEKDVNARDIQIYLAKTLEFMGHPPQRISLSHYRNEMGIATKSNGFQMRIACYGGWSTMEGGAGASALIILPADTYITRFAYRPVDVSKPLSIGGMFVTSSERNPQDSREAMIVDGWHPVQTRPDASRGFDRLSRHDSR